MLDRIISVKQQYLKLPVSLNWIISIIEKYVE